MPVERACEVCGKTFYVTPSIVKRGWGLTCSVVCRGLARAKVPVELVCEVCGAPFSVKPSHAEIRHTCSNECRHKRHSRILMGHKFYGGGAPKGHPAWGGFETRFTKENHPEPWNRGLKGKSGVVFSAEQRRRMGAKKGTKRPDLSIMNRNPEFIRKRLKGLMKKPTKPERRIIEIIEKNGLPFKYVGNGQKIIGTLNPDFIHDDARKVIEVFGRVFHDPTVSFFPVGLTSQLEGRTEFFKQRGYDCLILWDDELGSETSILDSITAFSEV